MISKLLSLILALSFLILLALKLPDLISYFQRNHAASSTLVMCLDKGSQPDLNQNPDHPSIWFGLMQMVCEDRTQIQSSAWKNAISSSPDRIFFLRNIKPDDLELASFAAQTHPELAGANFWLAELSAAHGDTATAILAYQRGLGDQPTDGLAWMALGKLYEQDGNLVQASHAYSHACQYVDRGKNGCPNAGRVYMTLGDYTLAEKYFRLALRQLPRWLPARRGLAFALLAQDKIDEALPILQDLADRGNQEAKATLDQLEVDVP